MDRAVFYCGQAEFDDFFRDHAADHHGRYLTRVYTAIATLERLQGNGIGKVLMLHAFTQTLRVAEYAGVHALTLEAIDEEKAATYKRWVLNGSSRASC